MTTFLIRRALNTVLVLLGVATVTFFLLRLTGDPVAALLPLDATPEAIARMRAQLGMDKPLGVQYVNYLGNIVQGDFGVSLRYREPALNLFTQRFPASLELLGASVALSLLVGIPAGIIAAMRRGKAVDSIVMAFALLGQAVPAFYLGLMLMLFFSVQLGWLPTGGRGTLAQLIMPTFVLGAYLMALTARMTRSSLLETFGRDYIRTARAKGLAQRVIVYKHALKPALIPIITVVGLQVGTLFSGAVVTETVFSWPGIGRLAMEAISSRDFPVVQAVVVISSALFVLVNVLTDVLYGIIDPRVRYG